MKMIFGAALSVLLLAGTAAAQTGIGTPSSNEPGSQSGAGTIARSTTSTGATVPNAGRSQIGEPTDKEIKAQQQSDRIMRSICKNC
jgi:hypothetical protein